ncbi:hypothetical protein BDN70DRAFT_873337 [Pholiota conissans]|uniref:Uncharacterized protein n=1 Tax=Pholiota conissans TaxID=109636 RepID=A0A9P5Z9T0_9AGAR|nr:hypothetical protein BDN70DRAFT_873337 [Pholiota conissans]
MRFTVALSTALLAATVASGLVIPSNGLRARDLEVREPTPNDPPHPNVVKAHRATTNMPKRQDTFHVPAAPSTGKPAHTFTGTEVRKAVFDSHAEAERIKHISKTQQKKSPLKTFNNRPHEVPQAHGGGDRPLPHMVVDRNAPHHPPGREYPLPNHHDPHNPGPARVITQQTKGGHHTFKGVIAHDQSRTPGPGYNDHFQVKPRH